MGTFRWRRTLCSVFLILPFGSIAVQGAEQTIGTVAALLGSATVRLPDGSAAKQLAAGDQVTEGAVVNTGLDSRLKISLRDGSNLSLGAKTELKLDHLTLGTRTKDVPSVFTQFSGYVRAAIARVRPGAKFEIHTPSMVAAVRGTEWIESYEAGSTQIFVVQGRVQAIGTGSYAGDRVALTGGQGVTFSDKTRHTPVVRWKKPKIDLFIAATSIH